MHIGEIIINKNLFEKALEMPPNERVVFAELILASIDHEDEEIRKAWLTEVESRIKAINEGRASLLGFEKLY